MYNRRFKFPKV